MSFYHIYDSAKVFTLDHKHQLSYGIQFYEQVINDHTPQKRWQYTSSLATLHNLSIKIFTLVYQGNIPTP